MRCLIPAAVLIGWFAAESGTAAYAQAAARPAVPQFQPQYRAQYQSAYRPAYQPAIRGAAPAATYRTVSHPTPMYQYPVPPHVVLHRQQSQPPRFNAPLYPAPLQNIPMQVGATMIGKPAFAPHEMMYPHSYHSMYGPFYYKVVGGWMWTPFGVESHDIWKLEGTDVRVKYRSKVPLLSSFVPPLNR